MTYQITLHEDELVNSLEAILASEGLSPIDDFQAVPMKVVDAIDTSSFNQDIAWKKELEDIEKDLYGFLDSWESEEAISFSDITSWDIVEDYEIAILKAKADTFMQSIGDAFLDLEICLSRKEILERMALEQELDDWRKEEEELDKLFI